MLYKNEVFGDIEAVNTQLNSLCEGKIVDKLLLDSRYWIDDRVYRKFFVYRDGIIKIYKFTEIYTIVAENGDIVEITSTPMKTVVDTVFYVIDTSTRYISEIENFLKIKQSHSILNKLQPYN